MHLMPGKFKEESSEKNFEGKRLSTLRSSHMARIFNEQRIATSTL